MKRIFLILTFFCGFTNSQAGGFDKKYCGEDDIGYAPYNWDKYLGYYREKYLENTRLPNNRNISYNEVSNIKSDVTVSVLCGSEKNLAIYGNASVLFIHGFNPGGKLGGGSSTWGKLPSSLSIVNQNISIFEFRWRTNARFQDVSADLAKAVTKIYNATGKPVHIVAHSFGGLLSRTYLQGLAEFSSDLNRERFNVKFPVASLTTVGTPHSGIKNNDDLTGSINTCNSATCFQAGLTADETTFENLKKVFNGNFSRNEIIEKLDEGYFQWVESGVNNQTKELPIQVLIGIAGKTSSSESTDKLFTTGDGLISTEGQRFRPTYKFGGLKQNTNTLNAILTEKILGTPERFNFSNNNVVSNSDFLGFFHTINQQIAMEVADNFKEEDYFGDKEVAIDSNKVNMHPTVSEINSFLEKNKSTTNAILESALYKFELTKKPDVKFPDAIRIILKNSDFSDYFLLEENGSNILNINFKMPFIKNQKLNFTAYAFKYKDNESNPSIDNNYEPINFSINTKDYFNEDLDSFIGSYQVIIKNINLGDNFKIINFTKGSTCLYKHENISLKINQISVKQKESNVWQGKDKINIQGTLSNHFGGIKPIILSDAVDSYVFYPLEDIRIDSGNSIFNTTFEFSADYNKSYGDNSFRVAFFPANGGGELDSTCVNLDFNGVNTISHNGFTYKPVTSPHTGRVWLDRNLGASRVCQSFDDSQCYGDYYQWGRHADGHEKIDSDTTYNQAININQVGHDKFILLPQYNNYDGDWAESADLNGSLRRTNWSKSEGDSICPIGYKVPTIDELKNETRNLTGSNYVGNIYDAYNSFLKLPSAGGRITGGVNSEVYLWSLSDDVLCLNNTRPTARASGLPVRCIKN